jgi:hypothetical protein
MQSQIETEHLDRRVVRAVSASVLFFFFCVFAYELTVRHWSDSEVWSIRQGALCTTSWFGFACSWKPLFNLVIGATHLLVSDHSIIELMSASRELTILIWLLTGVAVFCDRTSALLLICYVGSSLFLLDSSVARSDFFALPFVLLHFHWLRTPPLPPARNSRRIWFLYLSALAAVLMTPKALVAFACFLPFYFGPFRSALQGWQKQKVKTVIVVCFVLMACAWVVSWGDIFVFFTHLFDKENYGFSYWDPKRFDFIGRAFKENPQFPLLIAMWMILVAWRGSKLSRASQLTGLFALLALVLFPDKLPFWISTQILLFFFVVSDDFKSSKWLCRATRLVALFSVINGTHWVKQLDSYSNERQLSLIRTIENLLKSSPSAKIYDGLGLFLYPSPSGPTVSNVFFGPGQAQANLESVERLRLENFDIFVASHKLAMFESYLRDDLQWHYIELPGGVFIRALNVHIENPKHPGDEIAATIQRLLDRQLTDVERIAILLTNTMPPQLLSRTTGGNRQELFSPSELSGLPPLCASCRDATVAIVPTGKFLNTRFRWSFVDEFAFEPKIDRAPRASFF